MLKFQMQDQLQQHSQYEVVCTVFKRLCAHRSTAGVDLARAPETGLDLHGFTPVTEDTRRTGSDSERSEDADVEATESLLVCVQSRA